MTEIGSAPLTSTGRANPARSDEQLRQVAQELEATFLAEMLKTAGLHKTSEAFGGGVGEDQFGSFLVKAQADEMAKAGGIGLAEQIFEALKESGDGAV